MPRSHKRLQCDVIRCMCQRTHRIGGADVADVEAEEAHLASRRGDAVVIAVRQCVIAGTLAVDQRWGK